MADDDWIEEEDRAPLSQTVLQQQMNMHTRYDNSRGPDLNNSFGRGDNRGRTNHRARGRGGRNRGRGRGRGWSDNQQPFCNGRSKLTFQIAQKDVGRLIGKGGCNIGQIREATQCVIDIGRENFSFKNGVDIHITGQDEDLVGKCRLAIEKHLGYNSLGKPDSDNDSDECIDWDGMAKEHEITQKKRWAKSVPLLKNFYVEHPDVKCMSPEQVKEFREENNHIKVYNFEPQSNDPLMNPAPAFYHAFEPFPDILSTIQKQGFEKPSPIQAQGWPYLLCGKVRIISL